MGGDFSLLFRNLDDILFIVFFCNLFKNVQRVNYLFGNLSEFLCVVKCRQYSQLNDKRFVFFSNIRRN